VFLAVDKEILRSNPLENIEYEKVKRNVEIRYLTREQVKMLLAHPFQQRQMELARHMLLFTVFTGLAYVDLKALPYLVHDRGFCHKAVHMAATLSVDT